MILMIPGNEMGVNDNENYGSSEDCFPGSLRGTASESIIDIVC